MVTLEQKYYISKTFYLFPTQNVNSARWHNTKPSAARSAAAGLDRLVKFNFLPISQQAYYGLPAELPLPNLPLFNSRLSISIRSLIFAHHQFILKEAR